LVELIFFEWTCDDFAPILEFTETGEMAHDWRTLAMVFTVTLVVAVMHSFHGLFFDARKDLESAYDGSENLLATVLPSSIGERLNRSHFR